jgi:hypothetical protein
MQFEPEDKPTIGMWVQVIQRGKKEGLGVFEVQSVPAIGDKLLLPDIPRGQTWLPDPMEVAEYKVVEVRHFCRPYAVHLLGSIVPQTYVVVEYVSTDFGLHDD